MHPRFSKVLGPNVRTMLSGIIAQDTQRLNDNVSNLAEALIEYDDWAVVFNRLDTELHEGFARRGELILDLMIALNQLSSSIGVPILQLNQLECNQIIDYAVGLMAVYFWPLK